MSQTLVDSLEIRKLNHSHIQRLSLTLESHECWKKLMSIIPKTLDKNNYNCDLTPQNQRKYNSEHFRMIENESERSKKTCTEILFDEWGTSGRIRPALGHLLHLLIKAKLFRAADYVAVELLHQPTPKRPEEGPEAKIAVNLSGLIKPEEETEKILNAADNVANALDGNERYAENVPKPVNSIPKIVVTSDTEEDRRPIFQIPMVTTRSKQSEQVSNFQEVPAVVNALPSEDIIENQEMNIPNLSLIMRSNISCTIPTEVSNGSTNTSASNRSTNTDVSYGSTNTDNSDQSVYSNSEDFIPALSQISSFTAQPDPPSEENIPNLSVLNLNSDSSAIVENDQDNQVQYSENLLPDLDLLQKQSGEILTNGLDIVQTSSLNNLPDFNALQVGITSGSHSIPISNTSSENSTKMRTCSSPLPNLSLDTILPHYTYQSLEAATNNFNGEKYKGDNFPGRWLGSGEFGSVFLARDLTDRSVAVKKLFLKDVEVVNADDEVTKQFRIEVEVLCKYKHDNLVSLLGYSCDGSTYCLLYEYVAGGALRDRLQENPDKLSWKQRLNIAMDTAKAISYLHTKYSTPLIHRDIKSANILLDLRNQPKLCDFGLIKLIPNQNISTDTTVIGTSAYMPREAFAGEISVEFDTFSFGVVLLELLTSLAPSDKGREYIDLVTHLGETIENDDISEVVDYKAGSWKDNMKDYALPLYKIAQNCLEDKKKRPTMMQVKNYLSDLIKDVNMLQDI